MLVFVEIVEHGNKGATSHVGIKACLMAGITLNIAFHMLVVYISIGLQQLLVEAGLVKRLQVHLNGLHAGLQPTGKDLCVK